MENFLFFIIPKMWNSFMNNKKSRNYFFNVLKSEYINILFKKYLRWKKHNVKTESILGEIHILIYNFGFGEILLQKTPVEKPCLLKSILSWLYALHILLLLSSHKGTRFLLFATLFVFRINFHYSDIHIFSLPSICVIVCVDICMFMHVHELAGRRKTKICVIMLFIIFL